MQFRSLFAAAFLLLNVSAVHASLIAVSVTSVPNTGGSTPGGGGATIGWSFTANANLMVTALGYYDLRQDGLVESHQVGIWLNGGALLGSAMVTPSDSLLDAFRYTPSTPILLLAGQTYVIGAYATTGNDNHLSSINGLASFSTAAEITFGQDRSTFSPSAGFARPNLSSSTPTNPVFGRFGPNFQFVAVPEPTTALFGMALLGACSLTRLRGRNA